jgi:hypothetical protein
MLKNACGMIVGLAFIAAVPACYSPGGGMFSSTAGPSTFYSTESMQKSVTLVDLRTDQVVLHIDIPPGKQLTLDFDAGDGDDPVNTPDLLRYEVMELGTKSGKLNNSLTVPNAASRRLDVSVRQRIEAAGDSGARALRTDQMADRPDWWTPQGGPMPDDRRLDLYDR